MNATVERTALTNAAKLASDTADPKSPQPLLAQSLLRFTRAGLTVSATDLTTSVVTEIPSLDTARPVGSVCVDARRFAAAVASLPGAEVSVSLDEKLKVTLRSGKATVSLAGVRGEDFPTIPTAPGGVEIPAEPFAGAIKRAQYAFSLDVSRFPGPYFQAVNGQCTMVALDGHRMAVTKFLAPALGNIDEVVVPGNGISQINSALEGASAASLAVAAGRLSVKAGAVVVSVKLADAKPMPWRQVVPQTREIVRLNRDELLSAARRAGMMVGKELENGVDVTLINEELTLASARNGTGEASTSIALDRPAKGAEIRLSWRYLADALCAIDGEVVDLDYLTELDPVLLRSPGSLEAHVIMPQMRSRA